MTPHYLESVEHVFSGWRPSLPPPGASVMKYRTPSNFLCLLVQSPYDLHRRLRPLRALQALQSRAWYSWAARRTIRKLSVSVADSAFGGHLGKKVHQCRWYILRFLYLAVYLVSVRVVQVITESLDVPGAWTHHCRLAFVDLSPHCFGSVAEIADSFEHWNPSCCQNGSKIQARATELYSIRDDESSYVIIPTLF